MYDDSAMRQYIYASVLGIISKSINIDFILECVYSYFGILCISNFKQRYLFVPNYVYFKIYMELALHTSDTATLYHCIDFCAPRLQGYPGKRRFCFIDCYQKYI